MREVCLATPGGGQLLLTPGFDRKSLREVRRLLWLQTGDPRFEDRDITTAAGRRNAPGRKRTVG